MIEYPVEVVFTTTHIVQEWKSAYREKQDLLYPDEYMQKTREKMRTREDSQKVNIIVKW